MEPEASNQASAFATTSNGADTNGVENELNNMTLADIRRHIKNILLIPPTKCFPIRDIPPVEMAFSIDLIAEQIFSWLSVPELLVCRHVSRRWNFGATTQLRKRIELHFYGHNYSSSSSKSGQSLTALTELLQQEPEPGAEQHQRYGQEYINVFPCNRFNFTKISTPAKPNQGSRSNTNPSDQILSNFLSIYGEHIKELSISYLHHHPETPVPREKIVMKQLKKIVEQVPNLRILSVQAISQIEWEAELNADTDTDTDDEEDNDGDSDRDSVPKHGDHSPLRKTDPEFHQIHSQFEGNAKAVFNTNLKVLNLRGTASAKILEMVVLLAPNLKEINLDEKHYNYLVEPLNRLGYLKKLWIRPNSEDTSFVDTFGKVINVASQDGKFRPREIYLYLADHFKRTREVEFVAGDHDQEQKSKTVGLINNILELSAHSAEILKWEGVNFLSDFKLPGVMSKLRKLELRDLVEPFNIQEYQDFDATSLSNLVERFPKLQSIRLQVSRMDVLKIVEWIGGFNLKPLLSVKYFYLSRSEFSDQLMPMECLQTIYKLFPNTHVYYL